MKISQFQIFFRQLSFPKSLASPAVLGEQKLAKGICTNPLLWREQCGRGAGIFVINWTMHSQLMKMECRNQAVPFLCIYSLSELFGVQIQGRLKYLVMFWRKKKHLWKYIIHCVNIAISKKKSIENWFRSSYLRGNKFCVYNHLKMHFRNKW